jgi:hypothetical protein
VLGLDGWYSAWIAPATLVFDDVYDVKGWLGAETGSSGFYANGITRTPVPEPLAYDRWEIDSELGTTFRAAGFRQIIRREPVHLKAQSLTQAERGGLSFSEEPYDGVETTIERVPRPATEPRRERTNPARSRSYKPSTERSPSFVSGGLRTTFTLTNNSGTPSQIPAHSMTTTFSLPASADSA